MNTILVLRLAVVGVALAIEPTEPAAPGKGAAPSKESQGERVSSDPRRDHVEAILNSKIDLKFDKAPLLDVLAAICAKARLNLIVDDKALEEAAINVRELPVTMDVTGIRVRSILNVILHDCDLAWLCREEELIFVTTAAKAETMMEVRVYPVGDLVMRADGKWPRTRIMPPKTQMDGGVGPNSEVDDLIEMITSTVAPTTWAEVGGTGSIRFLPNALALTVCQTHAAQEEVKGLLAELHETRKSQLDAPIQGNSSELLLESYAMPRHVPTWQAPWLGSPAQDANAPRYEAELKTSLANAAATAKEFATVIPQVIEPASWKTAGGKGEIFVVNDQLVVRQTAAVQAQVAKLLRDYSPPPVFNVLIGSGNSGS